MALSVIASTDIPKPDLVGATFIVVPADRPFMVENHRDDLIWFCATASESRILAVSLMEADPYLSGNISCDGWKVD